MPSVQISYLVSELEAGKVLGLFNKLFFFNQIVTFPWLNKYFIKTRETKYNFFFMYNENLGYLMFYSL